MLFLKRVTATDVRRVVRRYNWELGITYDMYKNNYDINNKSPLNVDEYAVNKKILSDDIKMMHEFIEYKYFKKVMKRNNNIIE